MGGLNHIDYAVIIIYGIMTFFIGVYFARDERTSEDYFLAGRKLTWPLIALSIYATNIGAEQVVGLCGDAHRVGLVVGMFEWNAAYCLVLLAVIFVPQYLNNKIFTIPEFMEKRFSLASRMGLSGYTLIVMVLTKVSIDLWAGAIVLEAIFGWPRVPVMWGIGLFTAFYTAAGGLSAVVWTDAFQACILVVGSATLTILGLRELGGWDQMAARVPEHYMHMVKPMTDPDYPIGGLIVGNTLAGIFYWCMSQAIVQRVLGAKSVDHGRKGAIGAGYIKILSLFIFVVPGVIAYALYPDVSHDKAFPTLAMALLPTGMKGLVMAGLVAALMGSLSSTLNAAATLVTRDFFVRLRDTEPTHKQQIWIGRATVAVVLLAGILWAPVIGKYDTMWKYVQIFCAYMGSPLGAVLFVGILWRRTNNAGAISGMIFGLLLGMIMMIDSSMEAHGGLLPFLRHPILTSFLHRALIAFIISVVITMAVSLLTEPPPRERVEGVCFDWSPRALSAGDATMQPAGIPILGSYWTWSAVLIGIILSLLWIFR